MEFSMPYSRLFHRQSKNLTTNVDIRDIDNWPQAWLDVEFKTYERFRKIKLPNPQIITPSLHNLLQSRQSRITNTEQNITLADVSTLLWNSIGQKKLGVKVSNRQYPSAGGRYPIEAYCLCRKIEGLEFKAHHYEPHQNTLTELPEELTKKWKTFFMYADDANAAMLIVFTAIFPRSYLKYGERGYRHILIEAGHMGQNICLSAEAINLYSNPISGIYDERIETILLIDGVEESLIYTLAISK